MLPPNNLVDPVPSSAEVGRWNAQNPEVPLDTRQWKSWSPSLLFSSGVCFVFSSGKSLEGFRKDGGEVLELEAKSFCPGYEPGFYCILYMFNILYVLCILYTQLFAFVCQILLRPISTWREDFRFSR